jgi:VCBS repeat-containing protein
MWGYTAAETQTSSLKTITSKAMLLQMAKAFTDPTGNVLANDTAPDGTTTTLVVQDVRGSGVTVTLSATTTSDGRTSIEGNFGTLKIAANGSYTYVVNNSDATVQALNTNSEPLTDTFIYTVKDATGLTSTATLSIDIQGSNDAPVVTADEAINLNASINSTGNVLNNDSDVDDAGDSLVV